MIVCYPVCGVFLSISGDALFLHAKTAIFYIAFANYPIMCHTFCGQNKQKSVFKAYSTTLDKVFLGRTLHIILCFLLQHSVTFACIAVTVNSVFYF